MRIVTMLPTRLLATVLFCSLSNALAVEPTPTPDHVPMEGGYLPAVAARRALQMGHPMATPPPMYSPAELKQRDYYSTVGAGLVAPDNIVGYFTSEGSSSWNYYSCPVGESAFLITSGQGGVNGVSGGFAACCYGTQCFYRTTCIDSSQYYTNSICKTSSCNSLTAQCTLFGYNHCNLITYVGLGVSIWGCASSSSDNIQIYTTTPGQTRRSYRATTISAFQTGNPPAPTTAGSGGLSQPAQIGIGVGVSVGGIAVIAGVLAILWKTGVLAGMFGAGAAAAGGATAAGAAGGAAGASGASGAAGKAGFVSSGMSSPYVYTPGAEAGFSSPPPGYAPTGAEAGNFSAPGTNPGYFTHPAGFESMANSGANMAPTGYGPTGAEAGNFSAPGGPTGAESSAANFSAPGHAPMGPTGAEAGNFSAPGGPTGAESSAANFSAPAHAPMGPTGAEAANFSAPGATGGGPPVAPYANPAYFVAPAVAAPLAAGAAMLARRKEVGSPPSSPPASSVAGGYRSPVSTVSTEYMPQNAQHELAGQDVYRGTELSGEGPRRDITELPAQYQQQQQGPHHGAAELDEKH